MMGADFGYRVMDRVTTVLFILAGVGVLACAAFFVWVGVKLLGLLP